MKKILLLTISTVSALLICGFSALNLLIIPVALIAVSWGGQIINLTGKTRIAVNNPQRHTPELIAEALECSLLATHDDKRDLRLLICNPGINPIRITSDKKGQIIIADSHQNIALKNSDLWIADHPMPLNLKSSTNHQLYFHPSQSNRIHVSVTKRSQTSRIALLLIPLAAVLFYINLNGIAAALIALLFYILLNCRFT